MEFMESKAVPSRYCFFNSAEQNGEIGIHLSIERQGENKPVNCFFDYYTALRMRDALDEIVPKLEEGMAERIKKNLEG